MQSRRIPVMVVVTATIAAFGAPASAVPIASPVGGNRAAHARPQIRVDQLGYLPNEAKHARLMTPARLHHERFRVVNARGKVVLRGKPSRHPVGAWNSHYKAVYDLSFSRLTKPGTYRVIAKGDAEARSPRFRIAGGKAVYGTLLRNGVKFDQVQRDGGDVIPGRLHRRRAHLHDRNARIYARPHFVPGSDLVTDHDLHATGGRVNAAGGWYDAGDYLKFTHSTAYNDLLLFLSERMLGTKAPRSVGAEARHGLAWLGKMWDAKHRRLYIQVGIGSGNRAGTFRGDHDKWRLPQADDHDRGHLDRYVRHRPVFAAGLSGARISPNLVGRVSAAFALAAQTDAAHHPVRASRELRQARLLYAQADTASPPNRLLTALPHAFYPESSWHDDMELGATEIALAARKLSLNARHYVRDAARWAHGYMTTEASDTLNLYDTSALAHADLSRIMGQTGMTSGLAVSRGALVRDIRRQLQGAANKSRRDPFSAGGTYDEFDVNSHTFGLIATAGVYHRLTNSSRFDRFATRQRNWLLGGNPWGVSAMVGVGTRFPLCMQHQIANLSGTISGARPIDIGAVVNGPNAASIFSDGLGGFQDAMVKCPATRGSSYSAFDGRHSRYVDDVRSWQTDEPALDMTGAAIIAAAVELTMRHRH
jgi:endoglucanase